MTADQKVAVMESALAAEEAITAWDAILGAAGGS